tara:strand:- start:416 stop:598 length:183 start_codon:yes stop_codon:yes gene_type:complete
MLNKDKSNKSLEQFFNSATSHLDQDTLTNPLPEDLKTADSVAQLEAAGAPKLAALCKATL